MKLTNEEVLNVVSAVHTLSSGKYPVHFSWKLNTIARVLTPFATEVEKGLDELRKTFCAKDESGVCLLALDEQNNPVPNTLQIPSESISEFNGLAMTLLTKTIEVDNVALQVSDFPSSVEVSPRTMFLLTPIISDV